MNLKLPVIGNVASMQIYQLVRFGVIFLISILLTKSSLSTDVIGRYEFFLFAAGMVSYFWLSGMINSFLSLARLYPQSEKNPLYFNMFIVMLAFGILAGFLLFMAYGKVSGRLGVESNAGFYLLIGYVILSGPTSLIEHFYLVRNESSRILVYTWISLPVQLLLVGAPILAGFGIESAFVGLVGSMIFRLGWMLFFLVRHSRFSIDKSFIIRLLSTGWPLIIVALLGGATQYIDGSIITAYFDEKSFAVFRYGARELPFVVLMANAFSNSMVPAFSNREEIQIPLQSIREKTTRLMHILFPITFLLLISSNWLYPRIFNPEFSGAAGIFNIYLLLISAKLVFAQTILYGIRKNVFVMNVSIILTILHVVAALILVQVIGIEGVAFTSVIINIIEKIVFAHYLSRKEHISLRQYLEPRWWIFYNSLLIILFILVYSFN